MSDTFRLIRPIPDPDRHDASKARAALHARDIPETLRDFTVSAKRFQLEADLEVAINMALAVGAPLLLTGEPGTGKTQVAYYVGWYFGVRVYDFQVKSTSTAQDLKYDFDAVAYLRSAHHPEEDMRHERGQFVQPRALWNAYADANGAVLLIDEIDKAPRDFPNDLLQELDKHAFPHPFADGEVIAPKGKPPVVVITSNEERELPDAFLRRCIFHHLRLDEDLVDRVVRARAGDFPRLSAAAVEAAVERFFEVRDLPRLSKKPSTAELLVWLTILSAQDVNVERLRGPLAELPAIAALVKSSEDRKLL